jgi:hypothetical protein
LPGGGGAGILPRMDAPDLDMLRALARRAGFEWTDAELEELRALAPGARALLAQLDALPPSPRDPAVQFRVL